MADVIDDRKRTKNEASIQKTVNEIFLGLSFSRIEPLNY